MNLKSLMTGAAIAATVVSASVVSSASAQAAALEFGGGKVRLESGVPGAGQSTLNFSKNPGGFTTPGGTAVDGDFNEFPIKDIVLSNLSPVSWSLAAPVNNFLTGTPLGSFNLTKFVLTQENDPGGPFFKGIISGLFSNGNLGSGSFSSQSVNFLGNGGASYSVTLNSTPVPTPALLPGLVGLGVAALRKRKGEGAEKETVGVKA
jgi:hypothetical protein